MPLRLIAAFIMLFGGAGLGYVAYLSVLPRQPALAALAPTEPPPARVSLLVAAAPLQAGTLLKSEDLREREVAPESVPEGALTVSPEMLAELRGAMLRRYLEAGELIGRGDVLRPRDRGFLAAVMRSGSRAVSVGVDAVSGAAGLISPGDLVDLILTQELGGDDVPIGRRVVGETVLNSVRVIAVDQQLTQGATQAPVVSGAGNQVARTVTLEVSPQEAERIAVAQRLGRLTLAVRSIDAINPQPLEGRAMLTGADVSAALRREEVPTAPRVRVIHGNTSTEVVFP